MNKSTLLKILFFAALIYTLIALLPFAERTGGSCNAGVVFCGFGFILIICAVLSFISLLLAAKKQPSPSYQKISRVLIIVSIVIWGFCMTGVATDDPFSALLFFMPFFVICLLIAKYASGKKLP
jgi:hypothetical protein